MIWLIDKDRVRLYRLHPITALHWIRNDTWLLLRMSKSVKKMERKLQYKGTEVETQKELNDSKQCFYAGTSAYTVRSICTMYYAL